MDKSLSTPILNFLSKNKHLQLVKIVDNTAIVVDNFDNSIYAVVINNTCNKYGTVEDMIALRRYVA